ncbi:MAG: type II 3-dehydroquinate dehydratase [Caldimonas sp.]
MCPGRRWQSPSSPSGLAGCRSTICSIGGAEPIRDDAGDLIGGVLYAGASRKPASPCTKPSRAVAFPLVEVHIRNLHAREPFRHPSFLSSVAAGIVAGFDQDGYAMVMQGLPAQQRNHARWSGNTRSRTSIGPLTLDPSAKPKSTCSSPVNIVSGKPRD